MGVIQGVTKFLISRAVEGLILAGIFVYLPSIPPYSSISEPFSVSPPLPFEGKLALNNKLDNVELWHKGDLVGPESFTNYNGELYTSLYGGDIVKLTGNDHITPIIQTGKPCKIHQESLCGRPLGLEFDRSGALFVADAYYGLLKVNVKTGEKEVVVDINTEIDGKKPKVPNGIALARNGDIYWSDSSTEFALEDGLFDVLSDPSGRLIHYDAKTKENKVLINKLHFANGVALSDDEDFVIVAETVRSRIHRYYLKGPKNGTHDIFIDGLPGLPDNIKSLGKNGFLLPLLFARDDDHPCFFQVVGPFPIIRKLVARGFGIAQYALIYLNKIYPNELAEKLIHFIGHFSSPSSVMYPPRVTVIHVSKTGEILDSLHGLNKKIFQTSEAHIYQNNLYLGSPFNDYIGRISLAKVGWEHLQEQPREKRQAPATPQPTQTPTTTTPPPTQAPTTTTPPPTTTTPPPTKAPPPPTTTPPPKQTQAPAQKQTQPPTKKETPPPKQQTPPPKKETPPPKKETAPKQQTPPPKKETAPKQQAPPKKETSPSKEQAPPAKKETAQPKQTTPPVKQAPPTTKQ